MRKAWNWPARRLLIGDNMSIFRFRKNGKSTEQKPKTPKVVSKTKIECSQCGFSFWQPYISEDEMEKGLIRNHWTKNEDGTRVCPKCNAERGNNDGTN